MSGSGISYELLLTAGAEQHPSAGGKRHSGDPREAYEVIVVLGGWWVADAKDGDCDDRQYLLDW